MTIHELKILPEYYDAVRFGDKRFEIRKNDRDYHTGDILRLKEWDGKQYTGEELDAVVRYIYHGIDEYGLAEGYCVLSIDTMMHVVPRHEKEGHWEVLTMCANEGIYCSECHMKIFDRVTKPKDKLSRYCHIPNIRLYTDRNTDTRRPEGGRDTKLRCTRHRH